MSFRGHCLLICLLIALAPAAFAQTGPAEQVYATSVNNKIFAIDFTNGTTTLVVDDPGSNFQGLAVRNDLRIVVANRNQGGNIKIYNRTGTGVTLPRIPFPGGVTLDPDGNIYLTNTHPGRADKVWKMLRDASLCLDDVDPTTCVNGGYQPPVPVDAEVVIPTTNTPTFRLADTKFFNGLLYVLVQNPPYLLKYADAHECTGDCVPQVVPADFQGLTPSSLAFTANEILVGTVEGTILRFGLDGSAIREPFAIVPGKVARIAVGLQGGDVFAFLTVGKTVQKYAFASNGQGVLTATVGGLNSPLGLNLASAGAASVSPTNTKATFPTLTAEFDRVTVGGLVYVSCMSFEDPRETACAGGQCLPIHEPLATDLPLNDPSVPPHVRELGFPNVIPRYVRAFRTRRPIDTGEPSGPPTFRLCVTTKSRELAFTGPVELDAQVPRELLWLGQNPSCTDDDQTRRPRFFYTEEPPSPAIFEGLRFINQTSHCNRDGADAWDFSLFLTGARDTLVLDGPAPVLASEGCTQSSCQDCIPTGGILDCQLQNLRGVLNASYDPIFCVPRLVLARLLLDTAISQFDALIPDYCGATTTIMSLLAELEREVFPDACPATLQAELRARTKAIRFELGQVAVCTP